MSSNIRELSVESIRSRMIKNAARIWGSESEDIESTFDPMVTMLIEACAYELSKINNEILETQSRVLQRLAQVLSPETYTGSKPAYAIMHARSAEPEGMLNRESQFYAQKKIITAEQREVMKEIYFSPVKPLKIFDADVKLIVTGKTIFEYKSPLVKQTLAEGIGCTGLPSSELWIAIEANQKIKSVDDFTFFLDWKNNPDEESYLQLLPLTNWYFADEELQVSRGIKQSVNSNGQKKSIVDQYDVSLRTEMFIENFFSTHFYTVHAHEHPNILSQHKFYPAEFKQMFDEASLSKIQGHYLWFKLKFSGALNPNALNDLHITLNSFPVMNRKICKITYQLRSNVNIVPLKTDDTFFNIIDIQNSDGDYFRSNPLESGFKNDAGHYTLRSAGVERFDQRSATQYLNILLDLLRDESASFSALGNEFVNSYINQINQSIAMIENRLSTKGEQTSPSHFVIVTPKKPNENIFIRYYTTSGADGNQVRAGSKLSPGTGGDAKSDSLMILISSSGGKQSLGDNEKISAFRRSILTHDRIVTQEDVISFCYHQLGNLISNVELRKGWEVSATVKEGMIRVVEIYLTPKTSLQLSLNEWSDITKELQVKIDEASNKLIPVRVLIKHAL